MKAGSLFDGEETNVRLGMALSKVDSERFPFIQCVTDGEGLFGAIAPLPCLSQNDLIGCNGEGQFNKCRGLCLVRHRLRNLLSQLLGLAAAALCPD